MVSGEAVEVDRKSHAGRRTIPFKQGYYFDSQVQVGVEQRTVVFLTPLSVAALITGDFGTWSRLYVAALTAYVIGRICGRELRRGMSLEALAKF